SVDEDEVASGLQGAEREGGGPGHAAAVDVAADLAPRRARADAHVESGVEARADGVELDARRVVEHELVHRLARRAATGTVGFTERARRVAEVGAARGDARR